MRARTSPWTILALGLAVACQQKEARAPVRILHPRSRSDRGGHGSRQHASAGESPEGRVLRRPAPAQQLLDGRICVRDANDARGCLPLRDGRESRVLR